MGIVADLAVIPIGGCEDAAKQRVKQHFRKKNIYNKSLESIYKNDNDRLDYEENAVNKDLLYIFEQYLANNSIIADELIKKVYAS